MNYSDLRGRMLLVVCLLAIGGHASCAADPQATLPQATVYFDGQTMRLAHATSNDSVTLMEFIPSGQTLDEWTSLAAVYVYGDGPIGPQKRADALAAHIRKSNPEAPIASQDSPDSKQAVVSFAVWSAGDPFVEFNVFAFGTSSDGKDVGLQYALRKKSTPEEFLGQDLEPLRDRLVGMIMREGLRIDDGRDETQFRLALSPSDQAMCDTMLKNGAEGLEAVLESPDDHSAVVLFVGSAVAFDAQRLEDSGFLFYSGQLRLRFDQKCFPPKAHEGQDPAHVIRAYSMKVGAKINPAVMNEPHILSKALARVARWRPRVPGGYSPGYDFDQRLTEDDARAAAEPNRVEFLSRMGDYATLLNDKDFFSAMQVVKGLRVPGDDRLPTKEEYEAALGTMVRIEKEKGIDGFGPY